MRILLAHGAGAGARSEWMKNWKRRLAALGSVSTFEYSYMRQGRKAPDRLPVLIEAHRQALRRVQRRAAGEPIVLAGKSMGSRVACHLALEQDVDAVVCFGYPLVSPGRTQRVRDEVLQDLRTPILFVQGSKDPLCPISDLQRVQKKMVTAHDLHIVPEANHSLVVGKRALARQGQTQAQVEENVMRSVGRFLNETVLGR